MRILTTLTFLLVLTSLAHADSLTLENGRRIAGDFKVDQREGVVRVEGRNGTIKIPLGEVAHISIDERAPRAAGRRVPLRQSVHRDVRTPTERTRRTPQMPEVCVEYRGRHYTAVEALDRLLNPHGFFGLGPDPVWTSIDADIRRLILVAALHDDYCPDDKVRMSRQRELDDSSLVIRTLVHLLNDCEDDSVRLAAIHALGSRCHAAESASSRLVDIYREDDDCLSRAALEALDKIGSRDALVELLEIYLTCKSDYNLQCLLEEHAQEILPELLKLNREALSRMNRHHRRAGHARGRGHGRRHVDAEAEITWKRTAALMVHANKGNQKIVCALEDAMEIRDLAFQARLHLSDYRSCH